MIQTLSRYLLDCKGVQYGMEFYDNFCGEIPVHVGRFLLSTRDRIIVPKTFYLGRYSFQDKMFWEL